MNDISQVQLLEEPEKSVIGQIAHLEEIAARVGQSMMVMSSLGIEMAQFPEMFNELVKRFVELRPKPARIIAPSHLNHCNLNNPSTINSVDDYCSCQFHTVVTFPKDRHVFTGREDGEQLRKRWLLDSRDQISEPVIVQIPDTMYTISALFFIGLFADSLRKLGRDGFKAKYKFVGSSQVDTLIEVLNLHINTRRLWE